MWRYRVERCASEKTKTTQDISRNSGQVKLSDTTYCEVMYIIGLLIRCSDYTFHNDGMTHNCTKEAEFIR